MKRRKFLGFLGLALGSIGIYRSGLLNTPENISNLFINGKRLIIIHLSGGNDGLFTLAPKDNDIFNTHRKNLMDEIQKGINWGNDLVLNKNLGNLFDLVQKGWLSIIPNVGYPRQGGSHIISEEVWASGYLPGEQSSSTGWIGRLVDKNKLLINETKQTIISFTGKKQLIYKGKINEGVYFDRNPIFEAELKHLLERGSNDFNDHDVMYRELNNRYKLIQLLKDIEPYPGYPGTGLGNNMARISSIIEKNKPFNVFHIVHGGFDTHLGQIQRLNSLYKDLSSCLKKFANHLNNMGEWDNTQILIYSEFGRSITENSNLGTDHGTAGPVFVLGGQQIYGSLANLDPVYETYKIAGNDILKYQIDFRDIFNKVIDHWLT